MQQGTQLPISFHNTIDLSGDELKQAIKDCKSQEERIYLLMKGRRALTAFEVLDLYCEMFPIVPITSIRRALTNLATQKRVVKTHWHSIERYAKKNYRYLAI